MPEVPIEIDFQLIQEQSQWEIAADQISHSEVLAVDLEGNGYFRYPDRICLIQLAVPGHLYLVDPLAGLDLNRLEPILRNTTIQKVFHACENDLRALDRDFNWQVANILDTAVTAHLLGQKQLGLQAVLKQYLDLDLSKSKALQRQDWTQRPLPEKSLLYAVKDVAYLFDLRRRLFMEIETLKMQSRLQEECRKLESIRHTPAPAPEELFQSIKGVRTLTGKQRAILRELAIFRDQFCRELDRAPFRVLADDTLINLARQGSMDFKKIKGLEMVFRCHKQDALRDAIRHGKTQSAPVLKRKKRRPIRAKRSQVDLVDLHEEQPAITKSVG